MNALVVRRVMLVSALAVCAVSAQQQYVISTVAGGAPTPTPVAPLNAALQPNSVSVDASGNVYFSSSQSVFKIDTNGVLTRLAGDGRFGFSGDGGPALNAQLNASAIAISSIGDVYVVDQLNNRIRKVTADGIIATVVGTTRYNSYSGDGGLATAAGLFYPTGLALDKAGNLYIADSGNHRIRRVSTDGVIRTIAGNGLAGNSGDGGPATQAAIGSTIYSMQGLTVDANGSIYIAVDSLVRRVSGDGIITTVAGTGVVGPAGDGGPAVDAKLTVTTGIAVDNAGNLYIAESGNGPQIRRVSADGIITTLAGASPSGFSGDGGPAIAAQLGGAPGATGVAVDSSGNVFIADSGNNRIRKVSAGGIISSFAGNGFSYYLGDGGPAIAAQLDTPFFVSVDSSENLIISDESGQRVRKVSVDGTITTIAGVGGPIIAGAVHEGETAISAHLGRVSGVVADAIGNTFIADADNSCVWKVGPDGNIVRVAGNTQMGYSGDGGAALQAKLFTPWGLALDNAGNLYIADENAHRVRKVSTNGIISTVAGNGIPGFSGDGGLATSASLNWPQSVAVDSRGNLYIADCNNNRIRKVSVDGVITTVAGDGLPGFQTGDGTANNLPISLPVGIALDSSDSLYISSGAFVYKMDSDGMLTVIAGSPDNIGGYSGDGGIATNAGLTPRGLALRPDGGIYIADGSNSAIRLLRPHPRMPGHRPPRVR